MKEQSGLPYVFSPVANRHYFAFRMKHIITLTALGIREEYYGADSLRRHQAFLNNLMNSKDGRLTYDLRLISFPDADLYTRGCICISLICRMDTDETAEAEKQQFDLSNLLSAAFGEYEFETVTAEAVSGLLKPFELNQIVEISRRRESGRLDSLRRKIPLRAIGFTDKRKLKSTGKAKEFLEPDTVFHIYPFVHTGSAFSGLFKFLLLEAQPIAISCRLKPTALTQAEESFLEAQIIKCEQALQSSSPFNPPLRLQAQIFEQFQISRLFGLRDKAALGAIEIAASSDIPAAVVDLVGSLFTVSPGEKFSRNEQGIAEYLSGGYEAAPRAGDDIKDSFELIDFKLDNSHALPLSARRLPLLFDSNEAAAFFRFPPSTIDPPLGLTSRNWRSQTPPHDLPEKGCRLGVAHHNRAVQSIIIGPEDRKRHTYIVGQTGTGKTTLLKTMILEDIRAGEGLAVIDPHGDLFYELLGSIPDHRVDDVVIIDPTDVEFPVGLNMLECKTPAQRHFITQELVGIIRKFIQDEYGQGGSQMIGPIFFQHMRMNLLLAMSKPEDPGTLLEFYNIYHAKNYWKRWTPLISADPLLERWVHSILPNTDYIRPSSEGVSMGGYVGSKFEGFVFDPLLRNIFGQKKSKIDLRSVMDEGKILLVNLAKGELTEENSRFLGMILMAKLIAASTGRVNSHLENRRQFNIFVDEFPSIASQSFVTLVSEARKFGVSLVLASQFLTQIQDTRILQSIFGNVGTIISFRLGQDDAEMLERKFYPIFNSHDLGNLPNWNAYITTLVNGQATLPFSFETIQDSLLPSKEKANHIRAISRARYGQLKEDVESEIARSMPVMEKAKSDEGDFEAA